MQTGGSARRPLGGALSNGPRPAPLRAAQPGRTATPPRVEVRSAADVLAAWRDTPVEDLLRAQNLREPFPVGGAPALLVATCMDSRVRLALPSGAAFELRSAGVGLDEQSLFQIAFAVSVVGVRHVAVIGHDDCAMASLPERREAFVEGLIEHAEWSAPRAEAFFREHVARWSVDDPARTVVRHARALRERLPHVTVAPLFYTVGDGRLHQLVERAPADGGAA